jgi:hypothetical protein
MISLELGRACSSESRWQIECAVRLLGLKRRAPWKLELEVIITKARETETVRKRLEGSWR